MWILLSLINGGFGAALLYAQLLDRYPDKGAVSAGVLMVVTAVYLVISRGRSIGRVGRLWAAWADAKEAELQGRMRSTKEGNT